MNKQKTLLFTEGQTKLVNYIVSSCASHLKVEVRGKDKTEAELTVELLKAMETKLRDQYYEVLAETDELSQKEGEIRQLKEKIKALEEDLKEARSNKQKE